MNGPGLQILGDDATGPDRGSFSDPEPRQDHCVDADHGMRLDDHRLPPDVAQLERDGGVRQTAPGEVIRPGEDAGAARYAAEVGNDALPAPGDRGVRGYVHVIAEDQLLLDADEHEV